MMRAATFMVLVLAACGSSGGGRMAPGADAPRAGEASAEPEDATRARPEAESADPDAAGAPAPGPEGRLSGLVEAHNELRARHCSPPLRWSEELARVAQGWADRLASRGCAFEHNPATELGENLAYFGPPGSMSAEQVVAGWYDEVRAYRFRAPGFSMRTGHFTQVVWAATTEIGCGAAVCGDAEIWVCNYAPPGNLRGEFPANVRPEGCGSPDGSR